MVTHSEWTGYLQALVREAALRENRDVDALGIARVLMEPAPKELPDLADVSDHRLRDLIDELMHQTLLRFGRISEGSVRQTLRSFECHYLWLC